MSNLPKISLVIRTFNEELNILRCLTEISNQTIRPDEIIIVDNNSSDNTLPLINSFKIKTDIPLTILNNPIKGYSSGLNIGISASKYEWIGFLSADCFPDSNWLQELLTTAKEKKCDVVMGREEPVGNNAAIYVLAKNKASNIHEQKVLFF